MTIKSVFNRSFLKFLAVGVVNTLVGLSCIYILMDFFHLSYWTATFIGNSIGAIVSYTLNRFFTFKSRVSLLHSGVRFGLVIFACYFVSYKGGLIIAGWVFSILPPHLPFEKQAAVLFGSGLYTITNYFGQKYLVFRDRSSKENPAAPLKTDAGESNMDQTGN